MIFGPKSIVVHVCFRGRFQIEFLIDLGAILLEFLLLMLFQCFLVPVSEPTETLILQYPLSENHVFQVPSGRIFMYSDAKLETERHV